MNSFLTSTFQESSSLEHDITILFSYGNVLVQVLIEHNHFFFLSLGVYV